MQIYQHFDAVTTHFTIKAVNEVLHLVKSWVDAFRLFVNSTKSPAIIVSRNRVYCKLDFNKLPKVMYDGVSLAYVGLIIDHPLSWKTQMNEVGGRVRIACADLTMGWIYVKIVCYKNISHQ